MIGGSSSTPGDIPGSRVRSAQDALLQAIELAVAAEEVGIDGAYFRVHHFAEQQTSPFPLLAAIAARTFGIEIGTGVIAGYRGAWAAAGHSRIPRVSVSRSIVPLIDDDSRRYFGLRAQAGARDQVGYLTSWAWISTSGCSNQFPAASGPPWDGTDPDATISSATTGLERPQNSNAP
ncbi:MAG: alkane 1-monooxygenase [Arthrobacter sp.]|nr:alkane 1-monooxygenase [Arthrobacter sp.]